MFTPNAREQDLTALLKQWNKIESTRHWTFHALLSYTGLDIKTKPI